MKITLMFIKSSMLLCTSFLASRAPKIRACKRKPLTGEIMPRTIIGERRQCRNDERLTTCMYIVLVLPSTSTASDDRTYPVCGRRCKTRVISGAGTGVQSRTSSPRQKSANHVCLSVCYAEIDLFCPLFSRKRLDFD
jgi:hypothetical protein